MKLLDPSISPKRPYSVPADRTELLPFSVRLAEGPQDLQKAVEIRASAYSRHVPRLGTALRTAEAEDYHSDVLLLLAERKLDKRAIGTLRLEPNLNGPLRIEGEASLPGAYQGRRLVETTRLGVENGSTGSMVMVALVKAAFEICHACRIDYALALGRRSMVPVFRTLCYDVVQGPIPISYAYNVPLWIFAMPINAVESRLQSKAHPYFDFMARTTHPDIDVDYVRVFEAFGPS